MTALNLAIGTHEAVLVADELVTWDGPPMYTTKVIPLAHLRAALACEGHAALLYRAAAHILLASPAGASVVYWTLALPEVLRGAWADLNLDRQSTVYLVGAVGDEMRGYRLDSPRFDARELRPGLLYLSPTPKAVAAAREADRAAEGPRMENSPPGPASAPQEPPSAVPWRTVRSLVVDAMERQYAEQRVPIGGSRVVVTLSPDHVHVCWHDAWRGAT